MGSHELHVEEVSVTFELAVIHDLQFRLRRWRRAPELGNDWARGVPNTWLANLIADWDQFDVDALQVQLDAISHYRVQIEDQDLHFVRVVGSGLRPLPLLLTHGWPGSFLEYLKLIPLLADPEAHGAGPTDSFTLIVPSLPGFGFSGPPPHEGRTAGEVAGILHRLMTDGLGYERYAAHGSDLGAGVTQLARA